MPGYDRTGPRSQGPRTGGGFRFCGAQAQDADADGSGYGRGLRPGGRGLQRGYRRGSCFFDRGRNAVGYGAPEAAATIQPDPAKPDLDAEAADLRRRLDAIEQRLAGTKGSGLETDQA